MNLDQRLATVFRQCFDLAATDHVETLAYRQHPRWDSVGHMRLVAAIETEFNILLETEEILDLNSFNVAREMVKKHGPHP